MQHIRVLLKKYHDYTPNSCSCPWICMRKLKSFRSKWFYSLFARQFDRCYYNSACQIQKQLIIDSTISSPDKISTKRSSKKRMIWSFGYSRRIQCVCFYVLTSCELWSINCAKDKTLLVSEILRFEVYVLLAKMGVPTFNIRLLKRCFIRLLSSDIFISLLLITFSNASISCI